MQATRLKTPRRFWTAVAERSGDTAFASPAIPNVTPRPKRCQPHSPPATAVQNAGPRFVRSIFLRAPLRSPQCYLPTSSRPAKIFPQRGCGEAQPQHTRIHEGFEMFQPPSPSTRCGWSRTTQPRSLGCGSAALCLRVYPVQPFIRFTFIAARKMRSFP